MIIHNFAQRTPEWYAIRLGKFTASDAQVVATNGRGLDTLVFEKVAERLTGTSKEGFSNLDIERGVILEDEARMAYELDNGVTAQQVGFVEFDDFIGASPDGLVDDGLVEIKCPNDATFVRYLYDRKVEPKYYAQMQMQMFVTGRKWCDYVLYNPNFENPIRSTRIELDTEFVDELAEGLLRGKNKIIEIMESL
jgi:putative phage-type endonuclease